MNHTRRNFGALTMMTAFGLQAEEGSENRVDVRGGVGARIAFQYVGRAHLNFVDATGVIYGYVIALNGVSDSNSLFVGVPRESTAFLTFRADIRLQPVAGNGDLGNGTFAVTPILVAPGPFQIYFDASPSRTWDDPDQFSTGQVVARFLRDIEPFFLLGAISVNTTSAALVASRSFRLPGLSKYDFGSVAPAGVTNVTTGPTVPLPGSTPVSPIFGFAGHALTIGR